MSLRITLTIDDAPSMHLHKSISFLKEKDISALIFARGEHIEKYPQQIENAIEQGFLIGNHSYSHPYFSKISLNEIFEEIQKTEILINACYKKVGIIRSSKIIRFPFGDRGAGPNAMVATTDESKQKVLSIQKYLKDENFDKINFPNNTSNFIDAFWDWDTEDYKSKHILNSELFLQKLETFFEAYQSNDAVMLLHDFDSNHHLFEVTMNFLLLKKVIFNKFF